MAAIFHDGCWGVKYLIVFAIFFGSLYIDNEFFKGYMSFARYVSIPFLIIQAMLMLIVAYTINDTLVGNYEEENADGIGCSGAIMLFITGVVTIGNVVFIVYQYIWFSGCSTNNIIMTVTLLSGIASYVVVYFRTREDASILTSSIVVAYLLYLQWSALASRPNNECNIFMNSAANTTLQIIIGAFVTVISLFVISSTTSKSDKQNLTTQMNKPLMEEEDDGKQELEPINGQTVDGEATNTFPISSASIYFQLLLILGAFYYAMLLTNWGNPTVF